MSALVTPGSDAHHRLQLLLESTGEGIFGVDLAGRCTFVNRAAALMLGWRTEEVLGRNMHALIHHAHPDGSAFAAEYSSYPIVEHGEVRGAVVTFVDITERRRAHELLRRTNDELERRVAERTRELRDLANHMESLREDERTRIAREIRSSSCRTKTC